MDKFTGIKRIAYSIKDAIALEARYRSGGVAFSEENQEYVDREELVNYFPGCALFEGGDII